MKTLTALKKLLQNPTERNITSADKLLGSIDENSPKWDAIETLCMRIRQFDQKEFSPLSSSDEVILICPEGKKVLIGRPPFDTMFVSPLPKVTTGYQEVDFDEFFKDLA